MRKIALCFGFGLLFLSSLGQDMNYTKKLIDDLSSERFYGRGYVNKGDSIAAVYLSEEMKSLKLKAYSSNYYQPYTFSINTYPENPSLSLDGKLLEPAKDFIVNPDVTSCNGESKLEWITKDILTNERALGSFMKKDHSETFLAIDSTGLKNPALYNFAQEMLKKNVFDAKGVILINGKLKFSARTKTVDYPTFMLKSEVISPDVKQISYHVESKFIEEYNTQNIIGYIPGKVDTCLIFSAHYDHLGFMGDKMYPGANDNASGVAMVLNLAKHFQSLKKKPHYTLLFALFSGEEAGLLGAKHYVEYPIVPLEKTKMLINFDMVATGSEGIFVINGKMVPEEMEKFNAINQEKNYVYKMFPTGESSSSDHAPFHEKGVKAVFFYTHGDNADYHEITDTADKLPYSQFEGIFKLICDFAREK